MSPTPFHFSKAPLLFVLAYCLLSWQGCTKLIDYNYEYPGDQLAITAKISPQEGFEAYVYRSARPLGEFLVADLTVPDADVRLYFGDSLVGNVPYLGESRYALLPNFPIPAGSNWRIEVNHPELPDVISEMVVIPQPIVPTQFTTERVTNPASNREEVRFLFSTPDPPGEDFYVFESYPDLVGQNFLFQINYTLDFDFNLCQIYNYHPPEGLFFADVCFDENNLDLDINIDPDVFLVDERDEQYTRFIIRFRRIDVNYWRYFNDKRNLDSNSTVVEPRPSYTNLIGGFGVFMASNDLIRSFER